jgi:hypothetical protein
MCPINNILAIGNRCNFALRKNTGLFFLLEILKIHIRKRPEMRGISFV